MTCTSSGAQLAGKPVGTARVLDGCPLGALVAVTDFPPALVAQFTMARMHGTPMRSLRSIGDGRDRGGRSRWSARRHRRRGGRSRLRDSSQTAKRSPIYACMRYALTTCPAWAQLQTRVRVAALWSNRGAKTEREGVPRCTAVSLSAFESIV